MSDSLIILLLSLGVLAFLVAGLLPFNFDFNRTPHVHIWFITPFNGVANWACFVPLGMLIAGLSFVERPVLTAVICCALLSVTVESLQLFLPSRYSCVSDILLNTLGGMTGAVLATSTYPGGWTSSA